MIRTPVARMFRVAVLGFLYVWSLLPVAFVVVSSFKSTPDIFAYPPKLFFQPTFANYTALVVRWPDFLGTLKNSFIVAIVATALTVASSVLAGHVYSRYRHKALAASMVFMIGIRLLPPIVITLPLFPVAGALGLNDTYLILILLYSAFFVSLGSLILKSFIDTIPRELDESAMMDGAGEWQILIKIILPLAAQGMVAIAVFVFVYAWNEYLFAFIFTTSAAKTTPIIISEMMGSLTGVEWGPLFAAATVQLLPVVVFVIVAQKFLVAGLTAGAVKG